MCSTKELGSLYLSRDLALAPSHALNSPHPHAIAITTTKLKLKSQSRADRTENSHILNTTKHQLRGILFKATSAAAPPPDVDGISPVALTKRILLMNDKQHLTWSKFVLPLGGDVPLRRSEGVVNVVVQRQILHVWCGFIINDNISFMW